MAGNAEAFAEGNKEIYVEISPPTLSFGCVSAGYVYKLAVTVANKGPRPQMLKVSVIPEEGERNRLKSHFVPLKIASGVRQSFSVDLIAEEAGSSTFYLVMEQSVNRMTIKTPVKALIVPIDVFRHVAKSLSLQKRPIYRNGVTVLGAIGTAEDSRSIVTGGGASVLSEAIMDDADIEELAELPLVDGLYFDHHNGVLMFDDKLADVVVDGDYTLEEGIERTNEMRFKVLDDLEEQGYHVARSVLANQNRIHNRGGSPTSNLEDFSSLLQPGSTADSAIVD